MVIPVGYSSAVFSGVTSGSIAVPNECQAGDRIVVYLFINDWTTVEWTGNAPVQTYPDQILESPLAYMFVSDPLTAEQLVTQTFECVGSTNRWFRVACVGLRDAPLITVGDFGNLPLTGTDTIAPGMEVPADHELFGWFGTQSGRVFTAPVEMDKIAGFNEGSSRSIALMQDTLLPGAGASGDRTATLSSIYDSGDRDRRNVLFTAGPEPVSVVTAESESVISTFSESSAIAAAPVDGETPVAGTSEWSVVLTATTNLAGAGIEFPLVRVVRDVINSSHIPVPVTIRIYGEIVDPVIMNETTGESLSLIGRIPEGSYVEIDTDFGKKSVTLVDSAGVRTNAFNDLDLSNTSFWWLKPGLNRIRLDYLDNISGRSQIIWRTRYAGT